MEAERHILRVIERLGTLLLAALMAANLGGLLIFGQDQPEIMTTFLAGWLLAMVAALAAYTMAQLLFAQKIGASMTFLFWLSCAAGFASALIFSAAVNAVAGAV